MFSKIFKSLTALLSVVSMAGKSNAAKDEIQQAVEISSRCLGLRSAAGGLESEDYKKCQQELEPLVNELFDKSISVDKCRPVPNDDAIALCKVRLGLFSQKDVLITDQALVERIKENASNKGKGGGGLGSFFQKMKGFVSKGIPSGSGNPLVETSNKCRELRDKPGGVESEEYNTCRQELERLVGQVFDSKMNVKNCYLSPNDKTIAFCKMRVGLRHKEILITDPVLVKRIADYVPEEKEKKCSFFSGFLKNILKSTFNKMSAEQARKLIETSDTCVRQRYIPGLGTDGPHYKECEEELDKLVKEVFDQYIKQKECYVAPYEKTIAFCKIQSGKESKHILITDMDLVKRIDELRSSEVKEGMSKAGAWFVVANQRIYTEILVTSGPKDKFTNK